MNFYCWDNVEYFFLQPYLLNLHVAIILSCLHKCYSSYFCYYYYFKLQGVCVSVRVYCNVDCYKTWNSSSSSVTPKLQFWNLQDCLEGQRNKL